MLVFPNCKINIGLSITAKRADGFHDIESLFYPVPWYDALEIVESEALSLKITGMEIPGDLSGNLCIRAWQMLRADFPGLPPVQIHLHKTIPAGAGLGGGSSNGAFMLKALNTKFSLGLTNDQLSGYALRLGSDCPFFILNQPAVARGRGEWLVPLPINLSGYFLALANPGIHVPTGWAFGKIQPHSPLRAAEELASSPLEAWKFIVQNDFEKPVFKEYPVIGAVRNTLLQKGALFAAMSGTGSTCFGIFAGDPHLGTKDFPQNTLVKSFAL